MVCFVERDLRYGIIGGDPLRVGGMLASVSSKRETPGFSWGKKRGRRCDLGYASARTCGLSVDARDQALESSFEVT